MSGSVGQQFGQRRPPLSVSIKQILDRYPDGQIFKVRYLLANNRNMPMPAAWLSTCIIERAIIIYTIRTLSGGIMIIINSHVIFRHIIIFMNLFVNLDFYRFTHYEVNNNNITSMCANSGQGLREGQSYG